MVSVKSTGVPAATKFVLDDFTICKSGLGPGEYRQIGGLILDTLHAIRGETLYADRERINGQVRDLVARFPLPY